MNNVVSSTSHLSGIPTDKINGNRTTTPGLFVLLEVLYIFVIQCDSNGIVEIYSVSAEKIISDAFSYSENV